MRWCYNLPAPALNIAHPVSVTHSCSPVFCTLTITTLLNRYVHVTLHVASYSPPLWPRVCQLGAELKKEKTQHHHTMATIPGPAFSHLFFILFLIFILAVEVTGAHTLPRMITTELPSGLEEVDIIIIGGTFEQDTISIADKIFTPCLTGGTAGSIIASRLTDAEPQSTILVVEGGPDNFRIPTIVHPALYRANFGPQSNSSLAYFSAPEQQLANRSITIATGGVLGGGSSVNGAIYARAQQVDYDAWGTKGWSTEDLLPFLKKVCHSLSWRNTSLIRCCSLNRSTRLRPAIRMDRMVRPMYPMVNIAALLSEMILSLQ